MSAGGLSYENGLVVCLSFWLGVGFQNQLIFPEHLPGPGGYASLGPGRYSGNIRGSTNQIQYGIPASFSPPSEPYL